MTDQNITDKGAVTLDETQLDEAHGGAKPFTKIEIEGAQAAPPSALNFTKIEF